VTSTSASTPVHYFTAADIEAFGYARAVSALEGALRGGLDSAADPARTSMPVDDEATLLVMPSVSARGVGVKLVTHNPRNADSGHPLIHGMYVLFDRATLAPVAVLDGTALTTLRTPAVSVAAVRPALRRFQKPLNVVIFGLGPQGVGHLDALLDIAAGSDDIPAPGTVTYVARSGSRGRLPHREGVDVLEAPARGDAIIEALRAADVVVCATTSRTPLFDSSMLREDVVVIAVGSHHPDAYEVDAALCGRALVVVEDLETAMRECCEIVQASRAGVLARTDIVTLADVVSGVAHRDMGTGRVFFKGSGMAWEDLVVARAIVSGS
jgi:ornithine cyclodeaminase/alanine dehydrogenase-like protein (mu-crystallin family)